MTVKVRKSSKMGSLFNELQAPLAAFVQKLANFAPNVPPTIGTMHRRHRPVSPTSIGAAA
jgi:hypothetical protein